MIVKCNNILVLVMTALMLTASVEAATSIRVMPGAKLQDVKVSLGSIAKIKSDSLELQKKLEQMIVASFPVGQGEGTINVFQISRVLALASIVPASVDIYGASACKVTFEVEQKKIESIKNVNNASDSTRAPLPGVSEDKHHNTVADELRRIVARSVDIDSKYLAIDWTCNNWPLLNQPADAGQITIVPRSPVTLGRVIFDVNEGNQTRPVRVYGDVQYQCESVVASRSLLPGHVITEEDLRMQSRRVSDLGDVGYTDTSLVVGQEVARPIRANALINNRMIKKLQIVKTKDIVDIIASVGGVQISLRGRALSSGALGDVVTVRDERNKKSIHAYVTGPGQVNVKSPMKYHEANAQAQRPAQDVTKEEALRWES